MAVNPVEGWTFAAKRAVYGAVNSMLAAGAAPKAISLSILMPEEAEEKQLKALIKEIDSLCMQENILVLSGHTAVSPYVSTLILSVTAMGSITRNKENIVVSKESIADSKGNTKQVAVVNADLDLVVAGTVGREGAAMLLSLIHILPRIMTEYAHSRTGIDINSGAQIGEYFFIDHGTGVVIGETTEIGNNVKLYQGVTLGALSTRSGQKLKGKKRHPTIKDNVTVYSGASILGGETEIGEGVIVAGGAFVTKSVPAHTKVIVKNPEIKIKDSDEKIELQTTENKEGIWEI